MTDLRQAAEMALEALDAYSWEQVDAATKALRQALAQPELEPVAIVNAGMGGIEWLTEQLPDDTPLYAAPYTKLDTKAGVLHKEWIGLTGKEIAECIQTGEGGFVKLLATYRAIEARLKERNS